MRKRKPKPAIENRTFTPPEVARRWRCSPEKVHILIRNGQLAAFNIGTGKSKPRYRISQKSIDDFEANHAAVVQKKTQRRCREYQPAATDYFQ